MTAPTSTVGRRVGRSPCGPPGFPMGRSPGSRSAAKAATAAASGCWRAVTGRSAIFASSDLQAVGLLKAIREHGLSVPDDIAVVSFDGTAESEYCSPPLTVVQQPIREMAIRAVDRVLANDVPPGGHEKFDDGTRRTRVLWLSTSQGG